MRVPQYKLKNEILDLFNKNSTEFYTVRQIQSLLPRHLSLSWLYGKLSDLVIDGLIFRYTSKYNGNKTLYSKYLTKNRLFIPNRAWIIKVDTSLWKD